MLLVVGLSALHSMIEHFPSPAVFCGPFPKISFQSGAFVWLLRRDWRGHCTALCCRGFPIRTRQLTALLRIAFPMYTCVRDLYDTKYLLAPALSNAFHAC